MRSVFALLLFIMSWSAAPLRAQFPLRPPKEVLQSKMDIDSIHISLLTVSPGLETYERFGHTGIRIYSRPNRMDAVFHYGVFNFNAPHFIYRFVKGETDYQLGLVDTEQFLAAQAYRGLSVTEQELDLETPQKLEILDRLKTNYIPQNRTYRYSYLFDNCATRPFRLIDEATAGAITYRENEAHQPTLRDMLKEKTGRNTWLDFGISLVVTGRADYRASFREQMFLPDYLSAAYAQATIAGNDSTTAARPLVSNTRTLVEGDPDIAAEIAYQNLYTSPLFCFWALFIVVTLLSIWQLMRGRNFYIIDTLLLLAAGAAGMLVWFLCLFSEHPAVDENWNCLWLWPTHLIFAFLIWIKKCKKAVDSYFFINFAALLVYLICADFTRQHENAAFIPLIFTLGLRAFLLSPSLSERLRRKIKTKQ